MWSTETRRATTAASGSLQHTKRFLAAGVELREIIFRDLAFDPDLHLGYRQRMELETDLLDAWKKIQLANLLVWVNPVCPGGQSAMTKGFVDRLFLPGFSFKYQEDSVWRDKLLAGKPGHHHQA